MGAGCSPGPSLSIYFSWLLDRNTTLPQSVVATALIVGEELAEKKNKWFAGDTKMRSRDSNTEIPIRSIKDEKYLMKVLVS